MCVSDWRLGRQIKTQHTAYSLAAAGTLTVPKNYQRVGIAIGTNNPQALITSRLAISVAGVSHTSLFSSQTRLLFTLQTDGELPTLEWVLTAVGVTFTGSIIEYILPEEILAAGLNEFRRSLGLSL
jgi:hypothetical protein